MNPFHNIALVIGYLTLIFVLVQITKRRSTPLPTKSDSNGKHGLRARGHGHVWLCEWRRDCCGVLCRSKALGA